MQFLNCCSSEAWRQSAWVLHPARILVLNCRQSLFKLLILVPFVKIPKLLKFSIMTQIQLSGFSWGGCPYPCIRKKIPNLLWDLSLGCLLVLCDLKCWYSKFGPIIPDLGGTAFIIDHQDELRSRWVGAFSEWAGAGIKLHWLCTEPASCFRFGPLFRLWTR